MQNGNWKHCIDSLDQWECKNRNLPFTLCGYVRKFPSPHMKDTIYHGYSQGPGADPGFCQGEGAASKARSYQHREAKSHKQSKPCAAKVQALLRNMHSLTFYRLFFSHFWKLVQHQKLITLVHYIVLQSISDNFMLLHALQIYIFMKKVMPLIWLKEVCWVKQG